jgi:hypothetical protein
MLTTLSLLAAIFAAEPQAASKTAPDPTILPLLATLPEDGVWSKFEMKVEFSGQTHVVEWSVRSVGKGQQGGRDLRIIETSLDQIGDLQHSVHRMLVPVDAFGPDKDALGQSVRMWVKRGNDPIEMFDGIAGDAITNLWLTGATSDVKRQSEPQTIDCKGKQMKCDVFTGISEPAVGDGTFHCDWRILRQKEVPFGLAGAKLKIRTTDGNEIAVDLKLLDYGKNAEAKLPDLLP